MAWAQLQEKYATRLDVPGEEWSTLVNEIEQREKSDLQADYLGNPGSTCPIFGLRSKRRR